MKNIKHDLKNLKDIADKHIAARDFGEEYKRKIIDEANRRAGIRKNNYMWLTKAVASIIVVVMVVFFTVSPGDGGGRGKDDINKGNIMSTNDVNITYTTTIGPMSQPSEEPTEEPAQKPTVKPTDEASPESTEGPSIKPAN